MPLLRGQEMNRLRTFPNEQSHSSSVRPDYVKEFRAAYIARDSPGKGVVRVVTIARSRSTDGKLLQNGRWALVPQKGTRASRMATSIP